MSQAEALLNTLSTTETTVYSRNSETEGHIVIGNDRRITVPDSLKRIAVQYDHNVETVTFDCPRYWDNHDMSQMKVYINYLLPDNRIGYYPAENITPVGNTMTFTWTIRNEITQTKGNISILVCVKKTDTNGNESAHWNSELNSEMYISEGLEASQQIISQYPDIVTFLLTRMDEVEAIATVEAMQSYTNEWLEANHSRILAEIEAKGLETLGTIPADYTETHSMAYESARTKADAIVCSAEGDPAVATDSSDDYLRNLHIYGKTNQVKTTGKNLFDASKIINNSRVTNNNGVVTVSTPEASSAVDSMVDLGVLAPELEVGKSYILTFDTTGTDRFIYLEEAKLMWGNGATYTVTQEMLNSDVLFYASGVSTTATLSNFMIRDASIADTTYEPYSGGYASPSPDCPQALDSVENPTTLVCAKNLIPFPYNDGSVTKDGITFTVNDDGSIHCKGTATKATVFSIFSGSMPLHGTFTLSGVNNDVTPSTHYMQPYVDGIFKDSQISGSRTYEFDGNLTSIPLYVKSGATVDCVVYPQLEIGEEATEYEPPSTHQVMESSRTLRGIPVTAGGNYTDSDGQQWICDEIDFVRGVYIQRVGQFILGNDRTYYYNTDTAGKEFFYTAENNNVAAWETRMYCSHFPIIGPGVGMESDYWAQFSGSGGVRFRHKDLTSLAELATWLDTNNVEVVYPLVTPIETSLTETELAAFSKLHSNYPTTAVLNDSGAWVKMEYNADTKTYVDNKIKSDVTYVLEAIENGSY